MAGRIILKDAAQLRQVDPYFYQSNSIVPQSDQRLHLETSRSLAAHCNQLTLSISDLLLVYFALTRVLPFLSSMSIT